MEMSLTLLKIVQYYNRQTYYMYEIGWNSPSGYRAIYSGDDTWADNMEKPPKEACGDDVKRQVVDFM